MNKNVKLWLHVLGGSLGLLGVVFVAFRLHAHSQSLDFSRFGVNDWLLVGVLSIVCAANNLLLAKAWQQLLLHIGIVVKDVWVVKVYGISQLAKYVPGNIFHLAGRQAMGMAAGFPVVGLAKSTLLELLLLALSGVLFVSLILPLVWTAISVALSTAVFLSIYFLLFIIVGKLSSVKFQKSLLLYVLYLIVNGVIFVLILHQISSIEMSALMLPALCGASVVAWLAGFVVPGAPAGIGVREMVILLLLKSVVSESDLLAGVVFGRLVTTCGDFIFFASSLMIKKLDFKQIHGD